MTRQRNPPAAMTRQRNPPAEWVGLIGGSLTPASGQLVHVGTLSRLSRE